MTIPVILALDGADRNFRADLERFYDEDDTTRGADRGGDRRDRAPTAGFEQDAGGDRRVPRTGEGLARAARERAGPRRIRRDRRHPAERRCRSRRPTHVRNHGNRPARRRRRPALRRRQAAEAGAQRRAGQERVHGRTGRGRHRRREGARGSAQGGRPPTPQTPAAPRRRPPHGRARDHRPPHPPHASYRSSSASMLADPSAHRRWAGRGRSGIKRKCRSRSTCGSSVSVSSSASARSSASRVLALWPAQQLIPIIARTYFHGHHAQRVRAGRRGLGDLQVRDLHRDRHRLAGAALSDLDVRRPGDPPENAQGRVPLRRAVDLPGRGGHRVRALPRDPARHRRRCSPSPAPIATSRRSGSSRRSISCCCCSSRSR